MRSWLNDKRAYAIMRHWAKSDQLVVDNLPSSMMTETADKVYDCLARLLDVQIVALVGNPILGPEGAPLRAALAEAIETGVDLVGGCPHLDEDRDAPYPRTFEPGLIRWG